MSELGVGVGGWSPAPGQPHKNVQRFRGGLVFKAHRLCVSLNSRLESNKEGEGQPHTRPESQAPNPSSVRFIIISLREGHPVPSIYAQMCLMMSQINSK